MTLQRQSFPIRLIAVVTLVCAVIGAASAFLIAVALPKTYEARVSLVVPSMADTFGDVADQDVVLQPVIDKLQLSVTPTALASRVSATASKTSALLTVSARDGDASTAADIANAVAAQLVAIAPRITGFSADAQKATDSDLAIVQEQIDATNEKIGTLSAKAAPSASDQADLAALQAQLSTLLGTRSNLLAARTSAASTEISVLGSAVAPSSPASPSIGSAVPLGAVGGAVIGIGIALAIWSLRRREAISTEDAVVPGAFAGVSSRRG